MWKMLARSLFGGPLTEPAPATAADALAQLAKVADRAARAQLGRSLAIRHVDAGSCNACELEMHALNNPYYDIERFGFRFVASPRHADVLLVTGPVTLNMQEALRRTYDAMPGPKWVVAAGDCAISGGIFTGGYACVGAADKVVPVDLRIKGCPPTPAQLLEALLALFKGPGIEAGILPAASAVKPGVKSA
jgi:Ni,Fe-hydrogenase III small subunit